MDNSDYSTLLNNILNTDILSDEIQKMEKRTNAFNLIKKSWREELESYPVYEIHKKKKAKYNKGHACGLESKAFVRTIIPQDHVFNIIVAGEWIFQKTKKNSEQQISIVAKNCEPLNVIGSVMQEDEDKKLHTGARLFVKGCQPYLCYYCSHYHNENKIPFVEKNWCILSLKTFNGKEIANAYTYMLQAALASLPSFLAIFHMKIMSRTTFGEASYKICGEIEEMVVFQKMCLNRENFISLPKYSNLPIEYPQDPIVHEEE